MSLLDNEDLIGIKLYYKYVVREENRKVLIILEDKKAKEMLEDEEKAKEIEVLETGWRILSWQEHNEVMSLSSKSIDPRTGDPTFDFVAYRDAVIKRCLKTWNIKVNEQDVPVTPDFINKLPSPVILNLYQKFDNSLNYSEEEMGN
jgi:hypothetical protein